MQWDWQEDHKDFYETHLTEVGGVKFTRREVDVIAFHMNRGVQDQIIADALRIEASTVETHKRNIRYKASLVSSGEISQFVEKAAKDDLIREYYKRRRAQKDFEEALLTLRKKLENTGLCCFFYQIGDQGSADAIFNVLKRDLRSLGIEVQTHHKGDASSAPRKEVYVYNEKSKGEIQCLLREKNDKGVEKILLYEKSDDFEDTADIGNCQKVQLTSSDYYHSFLEIVKNIAHPIDLFPITDHFDKKLQGGLVENPITQKSLEESPENPEPAKGNKKKAWAFMGLILFFLGGAFVFHKITGPKQGHLAEQIAWNLPLGVPYYVERKKITHAIWDKLRGSKEKLVFIGLHGLGGIGKSFLAADLINNPQIPYDFRGWFKGETDELISFYYFYLGEAYKLFEIHEAPAIKLKKVIDWLEGKESILLVFDNIKDFSVLEKYLPSKGHIVVTSRSPGLHGAIEIDLMSEKESLTLLNSLVPSELKEAPTYPEQAKELIKELGHLPLAIVQAGAYMGEHIISPRDYMTLFRAENKDLLKDHLMPPGDKHEPVYVTWNINLKSIAGSEGGNWALSLLDFISYCHSQDIPKSLLTAYINTIAANKTELLGNNCLSLLKRHSLIRIYKDFIFVHRLVQSWIRQKHTPAQKEAILKKGIEVITRLNRLHCEKNKDVIFIKSLTPHMESILYHSSSILPDSYLCPYLTLLGGNYLDAGFYDRAAHLLLRAVQELEKKHGPLSPLLIESILPLSKAYFFLGKYQQSVDLLDKCLLIDDKSKNPNRHQTAQILYQMGESYFSLGEYKKSKQLVEKALELEDQSGEEEKTPLFSDALQLLGRIYLYLGDVRKAKTQAKKVIQIQKQSTNPDDVKIANAYQLLGRVYVYLYKFNKGQDVLEKALDIKEAIFGKNHINTANIYHQLGRIYHYRGLYPKAEEYLKNSLYIKEQHYGPDHIQVGHTLHQISRLYYSMGKYEESRKLLDKSLSIKEKHYGGAHVMTTFDKITLGQIYTRTGKAKESVHLYKYIIEILEKSLGGSHVFCAQTLISLAEAYMEIGDYASAKEALLKSLQIINELFGSSHIFVSIVNVNLGNIYRLLGDNEQSKKLQEVALKRLKEDYGETHVDVGKALVNYGILCEEMGLSAVAGEYSKKGLKILKDSFGPDSEEVEKAKALLSKKSSPSHKKHGYFIQLQT